MTVRYTRTGVALRCTDPEVVRRLLAKVAHNPRTGCWVWFGYTNDHGYGQLWWEGSHKYVHRLSYAAFTGPIPHGMVVDHTCICPACINPKHLEAVTQKENRRRQTVRRYLEQELPPI